MESYRLAAAQAAKALEKERLSIRLEDERKPETPPKAATVAAGAPAELAIPKLNMAKAIHRWDTPPETGFPIGTRVFVKRSNGTEAIAYVAEYDSSQQAYKVNVGCKESEAYKMCRVHGMRAAPPPTAEEEAE